jgi:uncharacterized membrane protein
MAADNDGDRVNRLHLGVVHAVAGALLFSLPMLMTMVLWFLGARMERGRLLPLPVLNVPLLCQPGGFLAP